MNRIIRKSQSQSASEVADLLTTLFAAALIAPAKCLWLVSPWISNVPIVDNAAGTYPALLRYGRRRISLPEVLATLAAHGTHVVIGTTADPHNDAFLRRLSTLVHDQHVEDRLHVDTDASNLLHTKALTSTDYALTGSMNITYRGINVREEQVELRTEPDFVAQARMDAYARFGGVL